MLILEPIDRINIASMSSRATKYCAFPAGTEPAVVREFMGAPQAEESPRSGTTVG